MYKVKTTRSFTKNVFELSLWEWRFMKDEQTPGIHYHIYRV